MEVFRRISNSASLRTSAYFGKEVISLVSTLRGFVFYVSFDRFTLQGRDWKLDYVFPTMVRFSPVHLHELTSHQDRQARDPYSCTMI